MATSAGPVRLAAVAVARRAEHPRRVRQARHPQAAVTPRLDAQVAVRDSVVAAAAAHRSNK